jgi:hypothetical protein
MNLTKNFTLEEMTKSETALRHDIDNTPGEQEISAMKLPAERFSSPCGITSVKGSRSIVGSGTKM